MYRSAVPPRHAVPGWSFVPGERRKAHSKQPVAGARPPSLRRHFLFSPPPRGEVEKREAFFGWGERCETDRFPHPTCSLRCARRPPHKGEVKFVTRRRYAAAFLVATI